MANRTVTLIRNCKTKSGWRRYPAAFGKNGRVRPGWAMVGGEPQRFEQGRYELRMDKGSKLVYVPAGEKAAEAQAARDRMENKLAVKQSALAAGIMIREEEAGRVSLTMKAREYIRDAEQRGAPVAADISRLVSAEFLRIVKKSYVDEICREDSSIFTRPCESADARTGQSPTNTPVPSAFFDLPVWIRKSFPRCHATTSPCQPSIRASRLPTSWRPLIFICTW